MGVLTDIKKSLIKDLNLNGRHLDTQDDDLIRLALDRAYAVGVHAEAGIKARLQRVEKRVNPDRRKKGRREDD